MTGYVCYAEHDGWMCVAVCETKEQAESVLAYGDKIVETNISNFVYAPLKRPVFFTAKDQAYPALVRLLED